MAASDWATIIAAIMGGMAKREEAKQLNRPTTTVENLNQTRTPYMAAQLSPQLGMIAQLLAQNYGRQMGTRFPQGGANAFSWPTLGTLPWGEQIPKA